MCKRSNNLFEIDRATFVIPCDPAANKCMVDNGKTKTAAFDKDRCFLIVTHSSNTFFKKIRIIMNIDLHLTNKLVKMLLDNPVLPITANNSEEM